MPRKTTAAVDELLTLEEVAKLLHCSTKTVRRMYNRGAISGVRLQTGTGPGALRFRPEDVKAAVTAAAG